jgi:hypothetical protein
MQTPTAAAGAAPARRLLQPEHEALRGRHILYAEVVNNE